MSDTPKRVVLAGAGHAHLAIIAAAGEFLRRGHELTIVAPDAFWYSGLATGMLGGIYAPELDQIDIGAFAAGRGAKFRSGRVIGLDRPARRVILEGGDQLPFDALSLNLGSEPPEIPGSDQPSVYPVKPISRLRDLRADLERRFARSEPVRIVVAGAGVTGVELAANLAALARRRGGRADIVVLAAGPEILRELPPRARATVRRRLEARGVQFRPNSRAARLAPGSVQLQSGASLPFDAFLNATGLQPPSILQHLDLPLGPSGALLVDRFLRSPADPTIHAAGDCIALAGHPLPHVGVYAIRQAPVLLHNLLASLDGTPPSAFVPQRRYLWIMNLGDGTGLAIRGKTWWHGRAAFRLKHWIDRRFLRAYQDA